jgi:hypothetical protein
LYGVDFFVNLFVLDFSSLKSFFSLRLYFFLKVTLQMIAVVRKTRAYFLTLSTKKHINTGYIYYDFPELINQLQSHSQPNLNLNLNMIPIPRHEKPIIILSLVLLSSLFFVGCFSHRSVDKSGSKILEQIDVAPVWSVHQAGPPELITRDGRQYVAYFDQDRFLTLAMRDLDSSQWQYHRFPVQMGWQTGSHAKLSLALDRQGYVHITCYRRWLLQEPPMPPRPIYYRSVAPHSIEEFEQLYMVSEDERTDYPTFITVDGTIYFSFRDGGSGQGDQNFYRYDDVSRQWSRVLNTPLIDGQGERSAYIYGNGLPMPGPDGRWHLLWVWRETPDHATNNSLSYARTVGNDLTQWESAAGVPVTPPFTIENTELVVDGAPPGGGLSNPLNALNWDSKNRVVISYHRFDENGASQIYNARFAPIFAVPEGPYSLYPIQMELTVKGMPGFWACIAYIAAESHIWRVRYQFQLRHSLIFMGCIRALSDKVTPQKHSGNKEKRDVCSATSQLQ